MIKALGVRPCLGVVEERRDATGVQERSECRKSSPLAKNVAIDAMDDIDVCCARALAASTETAQAAIGD